MKIPFNMMTERDEKQEKNYNLRKYVNTFYETK
jgi:hypothetical protein